MNKKLFVLIGFAVCAVRKRRNDFSSQKQISFLIGLNAHRKFRSQLKSVGGNACAIQLMRNDENDVESNAAV